MVLALTASLGTAPTLLSADERTLAMVADDTSARITEHKWKIAHVLQQASGVSVVAASPTGEEVASGSTLSASISIWNVRTGATIREIKGLKGSVQALAYSPDGQFLAVGHGMVSSSEISVHVFQSGKDAAVQQLQPPRIITARASKGVSAVKSLQYSLDGRFLAVGFEGGAIAIYEAATGQLKYSFPTPAVVDGPIAYSPSGQHLAIGQLIRTEDDLFHQHVIHLIDVTTGRIEKTFAGHTDLVTALAFSPDGKYIASGSNTGAVRIGLDKKINQGVERRNDDPIRIWDVEGGGIAKELVGHSGAVRSLMFSDNGRSLVSGSHDKTVRMWNVRNGELDLTLTGHNDLIDSVAITTQGKFVVSAGGRNLTIWEQRL